MAMEINGNVFDYSVKGHNYSSYAAQSAAGNSAANGTKKKETEKVQETAGSSKPRNTAEYANELAKLVPSVEFQVGNSFSTAKSGKTLTVNPQLLEKMQNDPEKEKEMKELIRGVESMTKLAEGINKGSGWTVVFQHSYIDENGEYRHFSLIRNDFMLNMSDELREERKKNSEKLIERLKENAAEKAEELQETLEEKKNGKAEELQETLEQKKDGTVGEIQEALEQKKAENTAVSKAEQLIRDKIANSKDGMVYVNDTEMKEIMEAIKEEEKSQIAEKGHMAAGTNLDLYV